MIKKFKIFENSHLDIHFSIGDEVTCIDDVPWIDGDSDYPVIGEKYLVIRIYIENEDLNYNIYEIDQEFVKELNINTTYVDVKNIKTDMILKNWCASRFKSEIRTASDKFNL